jgi:very-short-patch-repair endonuclease
MNTWSKNCPKCKQIQSYVSQKGLDAAISRNLPCKSCGRLGIGLGKKFSDEHRMKLSEAHKGKQCGINNGRYGKRFPHTEETKRKISENSPKIMLGKRHSEETKRKIGISGKGRVCSEETKQKHRICMAIKIQKYGTLTKNFNPNACKFIDNLNRLMGIELRHALNGGEEIVSGYFVDGYDKNKNIVFEYDERRHNLPAVKIKDEVRQKTIIDNLNPILFLRYDEVEKNLYDVITSTKIPIII